MIQEIANFVDTIPPEYHNENLTPTQGIHVLIDLDEKGELKGNGYKSFFVKKKDDNIDYTFDFVARTQLAKLVDINKPIDNKKKIHSAVPYVIIFKNLSMDDKNAMKKKDWDNLTGEERLETVIRPYLINSVKERISPFYDFFINNVNTDENEIKLLNQIKKFSDLHLINKILEDTNIKLTDYNNYIIVYFSVPLEYLSKWHDIHIRDKIFNKNDYNTDNNEYGLSNFLNSAPSKKIFMSHKTADYEVNNRIHYKVGIKLAQFKELLKNKKLPNIIPIFIDKKELNGEFVKIFSKDTKQSFREIIRQLFDQQKDDLTNYYLINWTNRNGIILNDVDYVSSFNYFLKDVTIRNIMGIKDKEGELLRDEVINNIFQFELSAVHKIFNNALIVKTKKETVLFKYFDEVDPKYTTPINYQNILRYRKNFYDYIYKSKEDAINGVILYNIIISSIIDDIKHDKDYNKGYAIKEKLSILFSLNKNFDKLNKNFEGEDMASKIPEYQNMMRKLLNDPDYHLGDNDNEFAFASGQLIYYLLTKSQTSNKTHSLLEPYISKNDPELFKLMISRGIEQYKHAFDFGSRRFEKLAGEVLGYNCNMTIKKLLPVILAGYFSQSLIFEKSTNQ